MAENAVSLKLPAFWTSQPEIWFAQAEAQFNLRGIVADNTKYYYLVAALDQSTASRLIDILEQPPQDDKYGKLKARLIATFGLSDQERALRLLHFRELGDSQPSALMDEMLALLGSRSPEILFKQLFLERLPEDIRMQLAASEFTDYRQMAKQADKLWSSRHTHSDISTLQRQPSAGRSHCKSNSSGSYTHNRLCYYHRKFGDAARRCQQPCAWSGNDGAGRQ